MCDPMSIFNIPMIPLCYIVFLLYNSKNNIFCQMGSSYLKVLETAFRYSHPSVVVSDGAPGARGVILYSSLHGDLQVKWYFR